LLVVQMIKLVVFGI